MTNIILCGYRPWAFEIFDKISNHPKINIVQRFNSNEEFLSQIKNINSQQIDLLIFIGWSWIINKDITQKYHCLGIHPSDLPFYRGGSPLQHQIINGLKKTKVSLMTLSDEKIDAGNIWVKEDLDLTGDTISDVFQNLVSSSVKLLKKFFDLYPIVKPIPQKIEEGSFYERRKSLESKLLPEDFKNKSLEDLYNFIRSLTSPYPNAYLEDNDGNMLLFTGIKYIPK
jgi:methionyl-tRNA formyltransferase